MSVRSLHFIVGAVVALVAVATLLLGAFIISYCAAEHVALPLACSTVGVALIALSVVVAAIAMNIIKLAQRGD